jgi:hypothetical protein
VERGWEKKEKEKKKKYQHQSTKKKKNHHNSAADFHGTQRRRSMADFAPRDPAHYTRGSPAHYTLGIVADPDRDSRRPAEGKRKAQWVSSFKTVALEIGGSEERCGGVDSYFFVLFFWTLLRIPNK